MAGSCKACSDLQTNAPNVIINGIDATACNSLKNNTGLNPSTSTDDCADLEDLNDCLVGNMKEEIDAYDVCDWKDFMKKFVPNVYNVLAGIICAICGLWTNIKKLWTKVNYLLCVIDQLTRNQNFAVGEEAIKFYNGVEKYVDPDDQTVSLPRLSGNAYVGYMTGTIQLPSDWTDRFPNSSLTKNGALLYEYRIKLSDYNLTRLYNGNMQENAGGDGIHAHIFRFDPGDKPFAAGNVGYRTDVVPDGYAYLQVRMSSYDAIPSSGRVTLSGVIPVLMNPSGFDC